MEEKFAVSVRRTRFLSALLSATTIRRFLPRTFPDTSRLTPRKRESCWVNLMRIPRRRLKKERLQNGLLPHISLKLTPRQTVVRGFLHKKDEARFQRASLLGIPAPRWSERNRDIPKTGTLKARFNGSGG